jgi:hypothetical protein
MNLHLSVFDFVEIRLAIKILLPIFGVVIGTNIGGNKADIGHPTQIVIPSKQSPESHPID